MRSYISRMLKQTGCLIGKPFGHGYVAVTDDWTKVGRCVGCPKILPNGGTYNTRMVDFGSQGNLARVAARRPQTVS